MPKKVNTDVSFQHREQYIKIDGAISRSLLLRD